jgi:hypothetical protein
LFAGSADGKGIDGMKTRGFAVVVLMSLVFALGAGMASAQEEGPILLPKPKPVPKPASPTLLVMCDLACNWKLDGEPKGRIDAGRSAKVKVDLGQHLVVATTEDGADQVKQFVKAEEKGQTIVAIELQPVRDARLKTEQQAKDKAEQEARDKAAQEARDKAAREQQEREQQERERIAREAPAGVWADIATGLMWTKKDNGSDVNWQQAMDYCRNLQLAGYSDWRLPTIDELQGIYDPNVGSDHAKGNLQLSRLWEWSSSQNASGEAWYFTFYAGLRFSNLTGLSEFHRALCVRRSGQ